MGTKAIEGVVSPASLGTTQCDSPVRTCQGPSRYPLFRSCHPHFFPRPHSATKSLLPDRQTPSPLQASSASQLRSSFVQQHQGQEKHVVTLLPSTSLSFCKNADESQHVKEQTGAATDFQPGTSLQKSSGTSVYIQERKSARDQLDKNLLPREGALMLVPQLPAHTSSAVCADNALCSQRSSFPRPIQSRPGTQSAGSNHSHPLFWHSLQGVS